VGGGRLAVEVSPLSLPGVTDVCYDLTVTNDQGATVWSEEDICASRYGRAGDVTFVGTCDATDGPDADLVATNTVTLKIASVAGSSGPIADYIDPCAAPNAPNGCQLSATCVENSDVPITFNLTLMREANQGFFDIGVNFRDIFCSAKYDCGTSESPLTLLHDSSGKRSKTQVIGLACTASPGTDVQTTLWFTDVKVTCTGASPSVSTIAPGVEPGNLCAPGAADGSNAPSSCAAGTTLAATGPLFQAALYKGVESLSGMNKVYLNMALGFEASFPADTTCSVSFRATADDANDPVLIDGAVPAGSIYPYIEYDVGNVATCVGNKAVDDSTEVVTAYTWPSAPALILKSSFDGIKRDLQITRLCEPGAGYLSALGFDCAINPPDMLVVGLGSRAATWFDFESGLKVAPGSPAGDLALGWLASATLDPQNGAALASTDLSVAQFNSVECSATDGRSYLAWPMNSPGTTKVVCLRTANGEYFKFARHVPLYGVTEIAWASGAPTGGGGLSSLTLDGAPQQIPPEFNCKSGDRCQRFIPTGSAYTVNVMGLSGYLQTGIWSHTTATGVGICQSTSGGACVFNPSGQDFLTLPGVTLSPPTGHLEASAYADFGLTLEMSYTCSDSANTWKCGRACAGVVPQGCTVTVAVVDGYQGRNLVWGDKCLGQTGTSCSYVAASGLPNYATVGFTSPTYPISVAVNGAPNSGIVYFDVPGASIESLPAAGVRNFQAPLHGVVRLTAVPGSGIPFPGWASGPCVGQGPRCAFEVSGSSSTVIQFAP
jgi:hypothetical protein